MTVIRWMFLLSDASLSSLKVPNLLSFFALFLLRICNRLFIAFSFSALFVLLYSAHIDKLGKKASVEVRIKVLTRQHEDMLFRLAIQVTDTSSPGQLPIRTQELFSDPIRVVSKPSQLLKRGNYTMPVIQRKRKAQSTSQQTSIDPPNIQSRNNNNNTASLDNNNINNNNTNTNITSTQIAQTLERLEQQQQQQQIIIEQLRRIAQINPNTTNDNTTSTSIIDTSSPLSSPISTPPTSTPTTDDSELEDAFQRVIACYHSIPADQRQFKLRRLLNQQTILSNYKEDVDQFINGLAIASGEVDPSSAISFYSGLLGSSKDDLFGFHLDNNNNNGTYLLLLPSQAYCYHNR